MKKKQTIKSKLRFVNIKLKQYENKLKEFSLEEGNDFMFQYCFFQLIKDKEGTPLYNYLEHEMKELLKYGIVVNINEPNPIERAIGLLREYKHQAIIEIISVSISIIAFIMSIISFHI